MKAGRKTQGTKNRTQFRNQWFGICSLLIICTVVFSVRANNQIAVAQEKPQIQIYLPREVTIKSDNIELNQVGIVRGTEALIAKANQVGLGRFSSPGQEIALDKQVILSRMVASGIPAGQIILTGAEQVTVKQQNLVISGSEFVRQAKSFLMTKFAVDSILGWNMVREPAEFVVTGQASDIKYISELINNSVKNQVSVEVAVFSGEKKLGVRNVTFNAQYLCRTAITTVDIQAGELIGPENVKIDTRLSNQPEPAGWVSPYGLVAKRALPADTVIRQGMAGQAEPTAVIKRNQNVVIRIEKPGFVITALGKAMQDGKADDLIKVRNVDSQRIIIAKVRQDLSVEPVL